MENGSSVRVEAFNIFDDQRRWPNELDDVENVCQEIAVVGLMSLQSVADKVCQQQ